MNSSVLATWAAQGSKEKNQFEFFLATFEGGCFNFSQAFFLKSSFINQLYIELGTYPNLT